MKLRSNYLDWKTIEVSGRVQKLKKYIQMCCQKSKSVKVLFDRETAAEISDYRLEGRVKRHEIL